MFFEEGYEIPNSQTGYMRFEQGVNKFRILSKPIVGMLYWITNEDGKRKPVRKRMNEEIQIGDLGVDDNGEPERVKHFWAFVCWNYQEEKIQVLEITQKGIQSNIKDLVDNEDWGDPFSYDITVTRKGQKLETKYTVQPSPKKALDKELKKAYGKMDIKLESLYDGGDPFQKTGEQADTELVDNALDAIPEGK